MMGVTDLVVTHIVSLCLLACFIPFLYCEHN